MIALREKALPSVKVLFLHKGDHWIRGSENALLTLFRGLDRTKITPYLCSNNRPLVSLARAESIEAILSPMPEVMVDGNCTKLQVLGCWRTVLTLSNFARQNGIHLFYCNGGSTCQLGYYAGKKSGRPVISHIHSPYNRRYVLLYRLHCAAKAIFVSRAVQQGITSKKRFKGQCEVVYNGVDVNYFRPTEWRDHSHRSCLSLSPDDMVFGQVSSMIDRKGVDVLLRAFRIVSKYRPEARLVLVGDGEKRYAYSTLAGQLGLRNLVMFAGSQPDPVRFYQHIFDVNVLASRSDAFPLTLLEAAASGLPSIASNVDGIGEAVEDGRTGLLFDSENYEMLADKMLLLAQDSDLRASLGGAARVAAVERFSTSQYCRSIERIILEEAAKGPS